MTTKQPKDSSTGEQEARAAAALLVVEEPWATGLPEVWVHQIHSLAGNGGAPVTRRNAQAH